MFEKGDIVRVIEAYFFLGSVQLGDVGVVESVGTVNGQPVLCARLFRTGNAYWGPARRWEKVDAEEG